MPDASKTAGMWPRNSWQVLVKIIRGWYVAEEHGGEVTQRKVAQMAAVQPSQVSVNKGFLQRIGIVTIEGVTLTEPGKRFGLGIYQENQTIRQQGLREIIDESPLLKHLLGIIRGRGSLIEDSFLAEVSLYTHQGKTYPGFGLGVEVLKDILLESGLVEQSGNILRQTKVQIEDDKKASVKPITLNLADSVSTSGLRRIPIPVSAGVIWYVEVSDDPDEFSLEKFIDMQKLIFSKKE